MRRYDKKNNIEKANILAEKRYLESKGLIKEDKQDPYKGKKDQIISDISKLKSKIDNNQPTIYVKDGLIYVSAEDGNYFADYYGEFNNGYPYIDPRLEKIADKYGMIWEWQNAGEIILHPF